jgi:predicted ATP-grasp superfamily ATP-dependent carboligase
METTELRAGPDWPPAVIAGAYQTGVLGVRSLVRRGVRACSVDSNRANPGFQSVYGPAKACPDPDTHAPEWLAFMTNLAQELGARPVLIASADKFVTAIARHAGDLAGHYILSPGIALQAALADKHTQYRLASEHGMPMPVTRYVGSGEEIREVAGDIGYPCLVKPGHFREWQHFPAGHPLRGQKIAIASEPGQLLRIYDTAHQVTPRVIVQEIIQGEDAAKRVYLSCYDRDGRRIAHAMFRELRCDPLGFGPATVSEPVEDPRVDAICDGFLRRIRFTGLCEFEMKWDARDGQPKLIEANPRLSGGGDAAPYAGVDLCWLHYLDLIGRPVEPVSPQPRSFRHIVLRADGSAIPAYWKAGLLGWRQLRQSYRGPRYYFDVDWRDWRYSLETIAIFVRSLLRGFLRRGREGGAG